MNKRVIRFTLSVFLSVGLSAAVATGDGTQLGTLAGRVLDEDGGALPGVTVEALSAERGFQRSATTDPSGTFTFPVLQPGSYTVKASLSGFQSWQGADNVVSAEKTTSLTITLRIAAEQATVTVSGEVPLVDKTNTSATTTVSSTLTQKLAIGRSYFDVITMTPGVTDPDDDGNPNSHGAPDSYNLYLFNGVDTTDPTTGTFGSNSNFEAIEEVVVNTSAVSAEYGRAQGAIVNVITKSGTNQFKGSGKVIMTNDDWNADNKGHDPVTGTAFARTKEDKTRPEYSFTLGGPVWPDHAWFFGAYEFSEFQNASEQTAQSELHPEQTGESFTETTDAKLWDAKLTAQATPSHLFTAAASGDPITGFIRDYWAEFGFGSAEREALTAQDQSDCGGVCLWQVRWSGVFGSNISAEALYADQKGDIIVSNFEGPGPPYFSLSEGIFFNGGPFDGSVERPRKQANLAVNVYSQIFGRSHNFKAGVDYQDIESFASFTYPSNESFFVTDFDPVARQPILSPGDIWNDFTDPEPSISTGKIYGLYLLDKFDVTDRLFFNLGVRADIQEGESDLGRTVIDTTNVSPRLTGVFDLFGNGKTLLSAAYGTYHQFLIQSIADSLYSGKPQQTNADIYQWDGSQWVLIDQVRAGGNTNPVNDDLEPSRLDEFNVAVQQQLGNTMAVGIRGVYRKWNNLVDDVVFTNLEGDQVQELHNFGDGDLSRYYKGIELTFQKRFTNNWQLFANYTLSRTEGNHFANFATALFDLPDETCEVPGRDVPVETTEMPCVQAFATNSYGLASYDRTHIFRLFSAYTLPLSFANFTFAPTFVWQSGTPYQRQRNFTAPDGTLYPFLYDKLGSSRLDDTYALNFALEATLKPWGPIEVGVKGEVFNLTNQQKVIDSNFIRLTPNETFGTPRSRNALQNPRAYRLTALVRF
jgi:hypothetical protein